MMMKFKDFTFPSNPSKIEIKASTNASQTALYGKGSNIQNVSINPVVVTGCGEFYGDRAEESCQYLQHMLRKKTSGILFLPSSNSLNAYLTEFSFSRGSDRNSISYSFTFVEGDNSRKEERDFYYTVARADENAFDIAHRCNITVDDIMNSNDYRTPFDIEEGDRVMLR